MAAPGKCERQATGRSQTMLLLPSCLKDLCTPCISLVLWFQSCTSAGGIGGPEELAMLFQGVMIDTVYFDAPGCSRQGWCHPTNPALP